MKKLVAGLLMALTGVSSYAAASLIRYTNFAPQSVTVGTSTGGTQTTSNAILALGNASVKSASPTTVGLQFQGFKLLNSAGGVISQGDNTKGVATRTSTGALDKVFIMPSPEPEVAFFCIFNVAAYTACYTTLAPSDCGTSPECGDVADLCEDFSWVGTC
jgi:hypothetical protein